MIDVSHPRSSKAPLEGSVAYRASRSLPAGQRAAPATPAAAFRVARRRFLAGERLDMQALALELGVSRQTLYRWAGSREELLCDVLFSLSDASFEEAKRATAQPP